MKKEKINGNNSPFSVLKRIIPKNSREPQETLSVAEKKLEKEKQPVNADSSDEKVSAKLDENIKYINKLMGEDPTMTLREFSSTSDKPLDFAAVFLDGLSNDTVISEQFIKPLMLSNISQPIVSVSEITEIYLYGSDLKTSDEMSELISAILSGDTVIFVNGCTSGIIADTKGYVIRSVSEPQSEKALKGPKEGFVENLMTNISLLRRKLKTVDFKIKFFTFGKKSNTKISVCYLDSVVNKKALNMLYERIEQIDIDAILDGNYLEEFIADGQISSFRTIGDTERPDTAAAKMLEGRIVIIVDGSPTVFSVPFLMIENFQTADDYYTNSFYASFMRVLRVICYLFAVMIPGLFIALLAYHSYMFPTELVISFVASRQGVPFSALMECIILLFAFEMLRETALRVPDSIGQPLSIVGALVLGDAAISARYASAPMLIVVAFACLAGLMVQNTKNSILFFRIFFLVAAALLGMYGFLLAFLIFAVHILSLESFGVEYLDYSVFKSPLYKKDYLMRAPWWAMVTFPEKLTWQKYRQKSGRPK